MGIRVVLVACLFVLGCKGRQTQEHNLMMTWRILAEPQRCGSPGFGHLANEKEVELRFVTAPNHWVAYCSNDLADLLTRGGKSEVPVTVREMPEGRFAVCEIAGVNGRHPHGCHFAKVLSGGEIGGGFECTPQCTPEQRRLPWDL